MTAKKVYIFPSGTIVVTDENGEQIPEIQGGWINFDYLRKLAQVIVKDNPSVTGNILPVLSDYVEHYRRYFEQSSDKVYSQDQLKGILETCSRDAWGIKCKLCRHALQAHYSPGGCAGQAFPDGQCCCQSFTTDEQFSSYCKSEQSEPASPSQEPQSPSHSQHKSQHDHTVVDQLAHMESILESNLQGVLEKYWERLSQTLLALMKCEEVECQASRTLVAQALNSLRLSVNHSHPKDS